MSGQPRGGETYFAHSANGAGLWHPLAEHLRSVGDLAGGFASGARWRDEARLAGLLHDLGKYGDRFQRRLHGKDKGLDHWSQGASLALMRRKAIAAALAIQGHHVGLQRADNDSLRRLAPMNLTNAVLPGLELSESDLDLLESRASADGLSLPVPPEPCKDYWKYEVAAMLDVRMLFSCLVDADFLDTEAHFHGNELGKEMRTAGPSLDAATGVTALNDFMDQSIRAQSGGSSEVRAAREALWRDCDIASSRDPGIFTLTAPAGSGKTLAALLFALKHARRHNLGRIVIAVPFLSVVEQTAEIYRRIFRGFPYQYVLEHHSLAGLGEENDRDDAIGGSSRERRMLSENWDAPIVLTTNVQLLESLFSNRPSVCRKLHRLMRSVVIFDEAQGLPTSLAIPTLAALSSLAGLYQSSVVFATATQPAFEVLSDDVSRQAALGWRPIEIVSDREDLFRSLKRVNIEWRSEPIKWFDMAVELIGQPQVLVICNLKRHALALLKAVQENQLDGVFHLSTNLCPEHRSAVLLEVRKRLAENRPCRLISTQCVEAGVDVDFPTVYRALGPLDAVAQAAGRCNREGRLDHHGRVIVFEPEDNSNVRQQYPTPAYFQAAEVTRRLLKEYGDIDPADPEIFRIYYEMLYSVSDPKSLNYELTHALKERDFAAVARHYRIIQKNTFQLLVEWEKCSNKFAELREQADQEGINAEWMRRAQHLAVSLYKPRTEMPAWAIPARLRRRKGAATNVSDEWFILEGNYYQEVLGFVPPEGSQLFIA
uniref:Metal dependent phosphohydrolase n=1 Tax=mine drainage metagenome TaxID=410659 RepID=E6PG15_9ZZZZ